MQIGLLDQITIGNDLNYTELNKLGDVSFFQNTETETMKERVKDMNILIGNKIRFDRQQLEEAKNLKLICVTGTGYNNVDLEFLKEREISLCNIPAYSTDSVAQHTFALLFRFMERISEYEKITRERSMIGKDLYNMVDTHFFELRGKTWGIIGLGNIGRQVAAIASAFGCRVIYFSASGIDREEAYERTGLKELLEQSDIISVHAPMNEKTKSLITITELRQMKTTACIINVGRGGIIMENDLVTALSEGAIAGACIDVYEKEPIPPDSPYLKRTLDQELYRKLILTPHIAWGAKESRQRAIDETIENIRSFLEGGRRSRIL